MTPTGRQVEFHPIGSLWYWRLTGSGQQPPEAIKSNYTSLPRVKKSALEYLNAFWDLSDNRRKRK